MIQDYVITIVGFTFSYSLIPTLRKIIKQKSASQFSWQTIFLTSIGLYIVAGCMISLNLKFSFFSDVFTAFGWTMIGILKYRYRKIYKGE